MIATAKVLNEEEPIQMMRHGQEELVHIEAGDFIAAPMKSNVSLSAKLSKSSGTVE